MIRAVQVQGRATREVYDDPKLRAYCEELAQRSLYDRHPGAVQSRIIWTYPEDRSDTMTVTIEAEVTS